MITRLHRRLGRRDRGVVAVVTGILMIVFLSLCAFAIDVGNWYAVGLQEQRAADAAALAGVTKLPSDTNGAYSVAKSFASQNGYTDGAGTVRVDPAVDSQPSRLKVTVTKTVPNVFGALLGKPTTTISKSAVADYVGPVPMGSPCNEFGTDPTPGTNRSTNCNNTGQFWANVGTKSSYKTYGDAYQDGVCNGADGCSSGTNNNYDANGYFYSVTLTRSVPNLQIEAFDPAFVAVGDDCSLNGLNDAATGVYAPGAASAYCTGDQPYDAPSGTNVGKVQTQFTVRQPVATSNPWDPTSYEVVGSSCTKLYTGYNESLANIQTAGFANTALKDVFRKWKVLCTFTNASAGTYFVQVKTNGLGSDAAQGHNRFGLRAYSTTDSSAMDAISLAGFQKMAIYANIPAARTRFHLARIPSTAAGHVLNVSLFDIGDSTGVGTVSVLKPDGSALTNCIGSGVVGATGTLPTCSIAASGAFNGKWETIAVPIPLTYSCVDADPTACWFRLEYYYGAGNQPSDTTSWTASLEGDPVRLIE